jgi:hypothetical protein
MQENPGATSATSTQRRRGINHKVPGVIKPDAGHPNPLAAFAARPFRNAGDVLLKRNIARFVFWSAGFGFV